MTMTTQEEAFAGAGRAQGRAGRSDVGRRQGRGRRVPRARGLRADVLPLAYQFGGLKGDDAKRLKDLERENSPLKRLLADAELEKAALKEIARGNL
jgi:hypothetical protein